MTPQAQNYVQKIEDFIQSTYYTGFILRSEVKV